MNKFNTTKLQSALVALLITTSAIIMWQYLTNQTSSQIAHAYAETKIAEQVATTHASLAEQAEIDERERLEAEKRAEAERVAEVEQAQAEEAAVAAQEAAQAVSEPEPAVEPAPVQTLDSGYKTSPQEIMDAAGIAQVDRVAVNFIISMESGWRPFVWNTTGSGAYGLCQALPGNKMATAGADWETNPVTQLRWCAQYAQSRYGGWIQAANAWRGQHWW